MGWGKFPCLVKIFDLAGLLNLASFFEWQMLLDFMKEVICEPTVLIGNSIGSLACTIVAAGKFLLYFPCFFPVMDCVYSSFLQTQESERNLHKLCSRRDGWSLIQPSIHLAEAPQGLLQGMVLLNCSGGMNNKAVVDDWRIKLFLPLLWLIDFLLLQQAIASRLFQRVQSRLFPVSLQFIASV